MKIIEGCKKLLIEVNQTCNLNCSYCFYRDYGRVKDSLSLENIKEIFEKCPNADEFFLTGGECFTSKNIDEIIDLLHKKGSVTVFTNGIILGTYDEDRFNNVVSKVDRFIISFDSFKFDNYICRKSLDNTLKTINRILKYNPGKLEVKVCISHYNVDDLEDIFKELISLGVKYLSINFVFDIKNSKTYHEIKNNEKLLEIFNIIDKYKAYFNDTYIEVLRDLYIKNIENDKFPCLADSSYYYLDCTNNYLICPGNCKKLGERGNFKECYSKECANEWEIMYVR